jgi:hypothetical protein
MMLPPQKRYEFHDKTRSENRKSRNASYEFEELSDLQINRRQIDEPEEKVKKGDQERKNGKEYGVPHQSNEILSDSLPSLNQPQSPLFAF